MTAINNILVIADADPKAGDIFTRAKFIAEQEGAHISVIGFYQRETDGVVGGAALENYAKTLKDTIATAMGSFTNFEAAILEETDIADWILSDLPSHPVDLIIKTGHRSEKLLYSPTDWQLIRETAVPVLILSGKKVKHRYVNLLATIDAESTNDTQEALNRKLLQVSSEFARVTGSVLHAGICIGASQILSDLDVIDREKLERKHGPEILEKAQSDFEEFGIKKENWHVRAGVPEKVISNIAGSMKADLVIMGSVGRKKLKGLLIGNTAEKILKYLHTDVLVIKPD